MLDDLILPEQLESLAGAAAFKRGEVYFREGRATIVIDEPERVAGAVAGSGRTPYYGQIQVMNDRLGWICSCPVGDQGDFCKHLVALAMTRAAAEEDNLGLTPEEDVHEARPAQGKRGTKEDEIRAFLEGQDKDRLVEWLLEVARWDRAAREKLLLAARRATRSSRRALGGQPLPRRGGSEPWAPCARPR